MLENVEIACGLASMANEFIRDLCCAKQTVKKRIICISDKKIWRNCKKFFPQNFSRNFDQFLLLENPKPDEANLQKIFSLGKNCDLIFAVGSGTINDLCKFVSAQTKIPYIIFASAASMNGYLSRNASIIINGHKKTLPATLPAKVFCDLEILSQAPLRLTKAGIGDSLCFYSCWFDWYLSHKILGTKFSKKPFELLAPSMAFFVKNYKKFSLRDEKFLKLLVEIIMLSGQGMTDAAGSYPASQSEHMIAHTIEMKFPEIAQKKLHGELIAVTTLTTAKLQKYLIDHGFEFALEMDSNLPANFFNEKISSECDKEYKQKISTCENYKNLSPKVIARLKEIYFSAEKLEQIFTHFKIKTSPKFLGLSNQQYQACVMNAKFTRNRFTCLDLLSEPVLSLF